jgi:hypothetical protein
MRYGNDSAAAVAAAESCFGGRIVFGRQNCVRAAESLLFLIELALELHVFVQIL